LLESSMDILKFTIKWLFISLLVGIGAGSASAFFLWSLDTVGSWREAHHWIIYCLPMGGILVTALYEYWGKSIAKGNNQIIEEIDSPQHIIPFRMAPLVLLSTLLTHLFGGSAGREGTAVQMGSAIADQLSHVFHFGHNDRRLLLACGISAGFASVFGTPLAGTVFAMEVLVIGRMQYHALLPAVFSSLIGNYICNLYPIHHTHYHIFEVPTLTPITFGYTLVAGILFGLTAWLFAKSMHFSTDFFKKHFPNPLLRTTIGGTIILVLLLIFGSKYEGLGIPVIVESFTQPASLDVFILKLMLTVLTLSVGFKGGEVTPLFFIGATLGSALSAWLPLPLSLLAGLGFVSVFAGAANTPIACVLMGLELFGTEASGYIILSCFVAYLFSGHRGIYTSQKLGVKKIFKTTIEQ
jgi:H+/Cl- antiporter ClcA